MAICEKCNLEMSVTAANLVSYIDKHNQYRYMCLGCWDALSEKGKTWIYEQCQPTQDGNMPPSIYRNGGLERYYPPRERLVHRVMEYLNSKQDNRTKCYDCGEFGILHIWMGRYAWDWQWLKPEPLPDSLRVEKE